MRLHLPTCDDTIMSRNDELCMVINAPTPRYDRPTMRSTSGAPHRLPSFFHSPRTFPNLAPSHSTCVEQFQDRTTQPAAEHDHQAPDDLSKSDPVESSPRVYSYSECPIRDSGFSRHDSLFSFGASSTRNAAELKSLLGSSSSRLRRGATVLSRHTHSMDKDTRKAHAVSLEQAKPRARVEVDIVLESDCVVEGGYLRGNIKIRVRKRQKKEAPVLLADGRVRIIGFECAAGDRHQHTFYQRASALSAITDAHTRLYDSPPDEEGFARAMEGVHILPFAMHLPNDGNFGSAKGTVSIQSGVALRYIAMISVKVKDSKTSKRSIAHFYRDCQVWPRLQVDGVLASAPRPIQASTARSISVIGGGNKLKLTAMLHRLTWIAGQRCYVRICIGNETKKTVKTVTLSLVRTTSLFKSNPEPDDHAALGKDICQTTVTHKIVAETTLERSSPATKNHASAEGWWTGVQALQEVYFSHHILLPPDALSVPRSRLLEVGYSIRVTASAGALTSDVHVTLPIHIINFLSVDPPPSEPLLSLDGSYTRLIPLEQSSGPPAACTLAAANPAPFREDSNPHVDDTARPPYKPSSSAPSPAPMQQHFATSIRARPHTITTHTPTHTAVDRSPSRFTAGVHGDTSETIGAPQPRAREPTAPSASESDTSMYSADSYMSTASLSSPQGYDHAAPYSPGRDLGNLELDEDADSSDEICSIVDAAQRDRSAERPGGYADTVSRHFITGHEDLGAGERYQRGDHTLNDPNTDGVAQPLSSQHIEVHPGPRVHREVQHSSSCRSPQRMSQLCPDVGLSSDASRTVLGAATPPTRPSVPIQGRDVVLGQSSSFRESAGPGVPRPRLAKDDDNHADKDKDEDEDGATTPTLRPTQSTAAPATLGVRLEGLPVSSATPTSGPQLQHRPSRALPKPPARALRVVDVPATVSALDALRSVANATASGLPAAPSDLFGTSFVNAPSTATSRSPTALRTSVAPRSSCLENGRRSLVGAIPVNVQQRFPPPTL
ncbi:hypothetical protein BD310DRAFT_964597 [Dichomitus squalens]|uniref:Arrestin C-terminal-like domain-containing protein n=1 Tax=Dichomitus squalens TaxID=114155 RepID=A0A4Q9QAK8_9APHY|nr:hypothetical protein BD310DRAFT_964597 [Dichomitus squalens]